MKRRTLVVRHPEQLAALSVWRTVRPRRIGRVSFEDQDLAPEIREEWARRLNRRLAACGCDIAALGLSLGILSLAAYFGVRPGSFSSVAAADLVWGFAWVFASTSIGKIVGLSLADRRLRADVAEMSAIWKPQVPAPSAAPRFCGVGSPR